MIQVAKKRIPFQRDETPNDIINIYSNCTRFAVYDDFSHWIVLK